MFCTSCGASLGAWPNKSCPRCGAPLQPTGETPELDVPETPDSPLVSEHYRKSAAPIWLAIVGAFALIVGIAWWGLGMSDAPVPMEDKKQLTNEGTSSGGTPSDGTPSDGTPSDGTPSNGTPSDGMSSDGTSDTRLPPKGTPGTELPPSTGRPPRETSSRQARLPPLPPHWLGAIRNELAECDSFFCYKKVQRKYCDGYWNRLDECKKSSNGL
jgi:hypothetical protein